MMCASSALSPARRVAGIALGSLCVGAFAVTIVLLVASLALDPDPPGP